MSTTNLVATRNTTPAWCPILTRNQKPIFNPEKFTHEMRMFKSEEEIYLLRHIANISAFAHQTGDGEMRGRHARKTIAGNPGVHFRGRRS